MSDYINWRNLRQVVVLHASLVLLLAQSQRAVQCMQFSADTRLQLRRRNTFVEVLADHFCS
jgi:hypothetical protein